MILEIHIVLGRLREETAYCTIRKAGAHASKTRQRSREAVLYQPASSGFYKGLEGDVGWEKESNVQASMKESFGGSAPLLHSAQPSLKKILERKA